MNIRRHILRSLPGHLVLPFFLFAGLATPAVSGGRNLQELIRAARGGDTLVVRGGTWEGDVVLDRRVALIGIDSPLILGTGRGSTVTIAADSCTLEGFRIARCGSMLVHEDAGVLVRSSGNHILHNRLEDILFGIYLLRAGGNIVADNDITGRRQLEPGQRGSGIHLYDSPRNTLARNAITDVRDGIYIQNAHRTRIEGNRVRDVRYGLHYMYADSNVFIDNRFENNIAGAAIMYSRGIVMRRNLFGHNRSFSAFGVLLQDCQGLVADSNVIVDNVVGLFFENSTGGLFRHNVVALNDLALQMFQNSVGNTFTDNAFIDNLSPLLIVGKRTESNWSSGGRGNYWSSYKGYDLDDDGIGDVPLRIQNVFQYLEARNPAVRLFLYSPASQALAAAASAFPIIGSGEESDRHPLMEAFDASRLPGSAGERTGTSAGVRNPAVAVLAAVPFTGLVFWWWKHGRRRSRS